MARGRARTLAGGIAAIVGGVGWVIKALAILLTGAQPALVFEAGAPLFALALVGLHAAVAPRTSGARVGLALLVASGALLLAAGVAAIARPGWIPADEALTPIGVLLFVAALGLLASLGALGWRARQERALPGAARHIPLALAIGALPAIAIGGALAELGGERLLEVPILVTGVAWTALGAAMLVATRSRARTT